MQCLMPHAVPAPMQASLVADTLAIHDLIDDEALRKLIFQAEASSQYRINRDALARYSQPPPMHMNGAP